MYVCVCMASGFPFRLLGAVAGPSPRSFTAFLHMSARFTHVDLCNFAFYKFSTTLPVVGTMLAGYQSQVTFQLGTGAECNLFSLKDYQRATADTDLTQVKRYSHKFIKTYANEWYKMWGQQRSLHGAMATEMCCSSTL